MYKMLLCCAAGMSTSLLVTKMEQYCQSQGIEAKIWAVPVADFEKELPVDLIMLGPQIRYAAKTVKEAAGDIPVMSIDMRSYGRMDGESVVKKALELLAEKGA
ncbi:MAG: PTS sugar transporter subunit IIB [Erysipelotrichaceae bacterium]|nr:PTS sugar transporter subunit IIB [Erysipelotrichaceae bacterium]